MMEIAGGKYWTHKQSDYAKHHAQARQYSYHATRCISENIRVLAPACGDQKTAYGKEDRYGYRSKTDSYD